MHYTFHRQPSLRSRNFPHNPGNIYHQGKPNLDAHDEHLNDLSRKRKEMGATTYTPTRGQ